MVVLVLADGPAAICQRVVTLTDRSVIPGRELKLAGPPVFARRASTGTCPARRSFSEGGESITPGCGYGFRARELKLASRNDSTICRSQNARVPRVQRGSSGTQLLLGTMHWPPADL
jgi:hypothetical protein